MYISHLEIQIWIGASAKTTVVFLCLNIFHIVIVLKIPSQRELS